MERKDYEWIKENNIDQFIYCVDEYVYHAGYPLRRIKIIQAKARETKLFKDNDKDRLYVEPINKIFNLSDCYVNVVSVLEKVNRILNKNK